MTAPLDDVPDGALEAVRCQFESWPLSSCVTLSKKLTSLNPRVLICKMRLTCVSTSWSVHWTRGGGPCRREVGGSQHRAL